MLNERLQMAREEEVATTIQDGLKRKDMFSTLCPNCNRKVQIKSLI